MVEPSLPTTNGGESTHLTDELLTNLIDSHLSGYPTHLGGDLKNLDWYDLSSSELVQASVGSQVKAGAILWLAKLQYDTALELGDIESARDYHAARQTLGRVAGISTVTPTSAKHSLHHPPLL